MYELDNNNNYKYWMCSK